LTNDNWLEPFTLHLGWLSRDLRVPPSSSSKLRNIFNSIGALKNSLSSKRVSFLETQIDTSYLSPLLLELLSFSNAIPNILDESGFLGSDTGLLLG